MNGHLSGKDPFLHPRHIDEGELQTFRGVKRHQKDPVVVLAHTVDVGDQRNLLQKAGERRRLLRRGLLIGDRLRHQLVDVPDAVVRVLLPGLLQQLDVSRVGDHLLQKLRHRRIAPFLLLPELPEGMNELRERHNFGGGAPGKRRNLPCPLQRLKETDPMRRRKLRHLILRRRADPALRHIQNPAHRDIVGPVVHRLEICQKILDFLPRVEIRSADHVVRNRVHHKTLLKDAGLRICPIQHGEIAVRQTTLRVHPVPDIVRDKLRLLHRVPQLMKVHSGTGALTCPERLLLSVHIVVNHRVRRIENILRGAVILLETHHKGIRKHRLKIQNVPDIRTAELVNRLIVVAHDTKIPATAREQPDQLKLRPVRILILIDVNILKTILIILQNLRMGREELHRLHQQIVKIQRIVLVKLALVLLVAVGDLPLLERERVLLPILHRRLQLILGARYRTQHSPLPQLLRIDILMLHHLLHQRLLIIRVIDRETRLISDQINITAQNPHTHRMKRRYPDTL